YADARIGVPVVRAPRSDRVLYDVVVEVTVRRHALHDVEQRGLPVVAGLPSIEDAIVPMITAHELVELEGGRRPRGEHHALALAVVDVERLEDRKSTRLNSSHDQISYAV